MAASATSPIVRRAITPDLPHVLALIHSYYTEWGIQQRDIEDTDRTTSVKQQHPKRPRAKQKGRLGKDTPFAPPESHLRHYAAHGSITIFVTFSFLSRHTLYISGASSSVILCEMM